MHVKIDLQTIEKLAPDQSSLKAAAGLTSGVKWSETGVSPDGQLIWGACAGSGANPYRVMADLEDLGHKCTCPSRKFPCKHVLAMLWVRAEDRVVFPSAETPDWVTEWVGRRRKTAAANPARAVVGQAKDLHEALAADPEPSEDPKAAARREAAAERRAAETRRSILDALDALEQWVGDQLRLGLSGFLDDATTRCRRIAARMVDGKAQVLAGRIDELPSRLLSLPQGDRVRGAVVELGKLVILARAYRAAPDSPELTRAIATAETREAVLENPAAVMVTSRWEVLGERVETRRDGLVSQTSWLLNLDPGGPRFAMLLDHFPASAGRRGSVFTNGEQFEAQLAFYPARAPSRALLIRREADRGDMERLPWPIADESEGSILSEISRRLLEEPWATDLPILLPAGRILMAAAGQGWWRARGQDVTMPVVGLNHGLVRATDLQQTAAVWSNAGLGLLAAHTPWGRIDCVG